MNSSENRKLDAVSLAAILISVDYGVGFLLGTSEKALTLDFAGSLYPVATALGTLALLLVGKLYWQKVEQIWTLLGNLYGHQVKVLVGLMAWTSAIGLESVQIIAGGFILKVLGLPLIPSMVLLAFICTIISLLPVEKASRVFQTLLVLNLLTLIYGLWVLHGIGDYWRGPLEFVPSLERVGWNGTLGIILPTMGLFLIDMSYQQFIVQAKNLSSLYRGALLAALILMLLSFFAFRFDHRR